VKYLAVCFAFGCAMCSPFGLALIGSQYEEGHPVRMTACNWLTTDAGYRTCRGWHYVDGGHDAE